MKQLTTKKESVIGRPIALPELGLRSAARFTQTFVKSYPQVMKWIIARKRPPASEVRQLFESLGATYIKIGQFIASSPGIFPRDYVEEFQGLLDDTATIPFSKIKKIIESDLKQPISKVYRHISEVPLASASIAQVHAATLINGEDVVVKVQKPGVQAIITTDMTTLYVVTRLWELILPHLSKDAVAGMVEEMYQSMIDECDFTKELEHIEQFRRFLIKTGNPLVVAPKPYPKASGLKVLTMERLYGTSLTDGEHLNTNNPQLSESLFAALSTWFESVTNCETFHADLHSGNMLLLDDGRVGFIDFGMVGQINSGTWAAAKDLVASLNAKEFMKAAVAMEKVGLTKTAIDTHKLAQDLERLYDADNQDYGYSSDDQIETLLIEIGDVAKNYGIRFPRSFTMLLKQFLYFNRYLELIAPGADLFGHDDINTGF